MKNEISLKQKLLVLTVGLNFISFLFCGFMMTQVKGALNNYLLWGASFGLALWAMYSFLFITNMGQSFSKLIVQMFADSMQMKGTVRDITDASNRLAQATTEQASALQETAASIEEMSAMIKKSAESAGRSRDVATMSFGVANKGKASVDQMVTAIADINHSNAQIMKAIDDSNSEFAEIVRVISEIGNKTKVINDIVFQTKLLSFNASVEAARAGEHGKGFAVVAEEVGSLAQMSGNAAKEISDMLEHSVQKVEGIVNGTREKVSGLIAQGRKKVEVGNSVALICGEVLEEVVKNVTTLNLMVDEISTASHEQAQGIAEITRAINQLDQVTHSNAITSQQTATAAIQLNAQTDVLAKYIHSFKKIIHGSEESLEQESPLVKASPVKGTKVIQIKKTVSPQHTSVSSEFQVAVGSDAVPSQDDPRFKDV